MFNKFFDEYKIGQKWISKGRTITEADIINFAGVSGDWYPLHTNLEYAASTPFKQRIAHGMLVLSAATGLMQFEPGRLVAFYGIENLRFIKPTFIHDTIHVEMVVKELENKGNGTGILTVEEQIKKQNDEIVATGTVKVLMNVKGA